ncbi:hypothetical protein NDU88_006582 [Pleurodeles waltl]|uniref:Uncharacterized protein n=1 Tax=Pleurodeles waltl TaxID=8319 RepID=A0AAV7WE12_PLEWA|nr:hypothetical protein NDU88_006582 [Pleurodeles waltl]
MALPCRCVVVPSRSFSGPGTMVAHHLRGPPPLSARGGGAAPQHPGSRGGRGPVRAPPSQHAPGPVRRRTLVRGSAEFRRLHPLQRLRSRPPSLGSRNSATPEAPPLHHLGGHAGG